jgi:hypothetical protein
MRFPLTAIFAFATSCAWASLPPRDLKDYAIEEAHYVPKRWIRQDRAPLDDLIDLSISLKQGNFAELERLLYEGAHYEPSVWKCF